MSWFAAAEARITAAARIASRTACAVPSPQMGSKAMAAEPQASQLGPHKGEAMRGCAGKRDEGSIISSIWRTTRLLRPSKFAGVSPTDSRNARPSGPEMRNSQPFTKDSIQQASRSEVLVKVTDPAKANLEPNACSVAAWGSGWDAKIVQ